MFHVLSIHDILYLIYCAETVCPSSVFIDKLKVCLLWGFLQKLVYSLCTEMKQSFIYLAKRKPAFEACNQERQVLSSWGTWYVKYYGHEWLNKYTNNIIINRIFIKQACKSCEIKPSFQNIFKGADTYSKLCIKFKAKNNRSSDIKV